MHTKNTSESYKCTISEQNDETVWNITNQCTAVA